MYSRIFLASCVKKLVAKSETESLEWTMENLLCVNFNFALY